MGRLIKMTVIGIRVVTPWVLRAFWATVFLMAASIASLWVGVPNSVRRVASHWTERASSNPFFITIYDDYLYKAICVVAFLTIVTGWICLAYVTVFVLGIIF
jgi:hypothetical protein